MEEITLEEAVEKFGEVYLRPRTPRYADRTAFAQDALNQLRK